MDEISQAVMQFLSELLPPERLAGLQSNTALRTSGILDSMGMLRLIALIEDRFGIEVSASEAGVENFDRLQAIVAFIRRKRAANP